MRTSDSDRDAVIGVLNEAFAHGRLEAQEFETRVEQAMRTGTYRELYRVLDGLPIDPRRLPKPPRARRPAWMLPTALGAALMLAGAGTAGWLASRGPDVAPDAAASSVPSSSPTPTPSPSQTPTPTPTGQLTPAPAASSAQAGAGEQGAGVVADPTVEPVTRSGSGTRIVSVPWTAGVMPMIEFQVDKPRWTTFSLSDDDGNPFFTYIDADGGGGRSTGTTVMPRYDIPDGDTLRLKVETEGAWTLTLRDVDDAPVLQRSGNGSGYGVFWYDGPEAVFGFDAADGLYSVSSNYDFFLNGVGPEHDEGVIGAGRRLVLIESDGPWSYEIR